MLTGCTAMPSLRSGAKKTPKSADLKGRTLWPSVLVPSGKIAIRSPWREAREELGLLPLGLGGAAVDEHGADRPADVPDHRPAADLGLGDEEGRCGPLQRHDVDPARMVGDEGAAAAHRPAMLHEAEAERGQRLRRPEPDDPRAQRGHRAAGDTRRDEVDGAEEEKDGEEHGEGQRATRPARRTSRTRSARVSGGRTGGSASFQPALTRDDLASAGRIAGSARSSARCPSPRRRRWC